MYAQLSGRRSGRGVGGGGGTRVSRACGGDASSKGRLGTRRCPRVFSGAWGELGWMVDRPSERGPSGDGFGWIVGADSKGHRRILWCPRGVSEAWVRFGWLIDAICQSHHWARRHPRVLSWAWDGFGWLVDVDVLRYLRLVWTYHGTGLWWRRVGLPNASVRGFGGLPNAQRSSQRAGSLPLAKGPWREPVFELD